MQEDNLKDFSDHLQFIFSFLLGNQKAFGHPIPAIPNLFGTRNQFHGKTVFPQTKGRRGMVWGDSSTLHLLCTLFLI